MQKILVGEMYQWREGHIQHLSVLHKEGKNLPDSSRGRYAAVWKVFSQKLFLSSIIISYPFLGTQTLNKPLQLLRLWKVASSRATGSSNLCLSSGT